MLAELRTAGLVTRSQDEVDRRQWLIAITPDGEQALARDMAERDAWLADALGTLTDVEQDLLTIAARLMHRLADAEAASG